MAAGSGTAQVIDLAEARRQRQSRGQGNRQMPQPWMMPIAWVPVWFLMPMWLPGQMPPAAQIGG